MVDYKSKIKVGVFVLIGLAIIAAGISVYALNQKGQSKAASQDDTAVYELVWNGSENVHQPIADFNSFLMNSDQPVLIDFWAEWCSPCRQAAPTIEALAQTYAGKVHVVKVNTDLAPDIASSFGVSGIPNFVIVKDGKIFNSITGFGEGLEGALGGMLDSALA